MRLSVRGGREEDKREAGEGSKNPKLLNSQLTVHIHEERISHCGWSSKNDKRL
jgi:hypothetical protein